VNVGNIGSPITVSVDTNDVSAIRQNQSAIPNTAGVYSPYDLNKDGRVNAADTSIARQNLNTIGAITLFTAPVTPPSLSSELDHSDVAEETPGQSESSIPVIDIESAIPESTHSNRTPVDSATPVGGRPLIPYAVVASQRVHHTNLREDSFSIANATENTKEASCRGKSKSMVPKVSRKISLQTLDSIFAELGRNA
jgi:hypothetical protein